MLMIITLLLEIIIFIIPPTHSAPTNDIELSIDPHSTITDLHHLSKEELCQALCQTPTGDRSYFIYEAEMFVLRFVSSELSRIKRTLRRLISKKTYTYAEGRFYFDDLTKLSKQLTYALKGVNDTFLAIFEETAILFGLESPSNRFVEALSLDDEVDRLQKTWMNDYYDSLREKSQAWDSF